MKNKRTYMMIAILSCYSSLLVIVISNVPLYLWVLIMFPTTFIAAISMFSVSKIFELEENQKKIQEEMKQLSNR